MRPASVLEAAKYLNVSVGWIYKLSEEGKLPIIRGHIRLNTLQEYKKQSMVDRRKALDELAKLGQETNNEKGNTFKDGLGRKV